jgi:hypothetical protein
MRHTIPQERLAPRDHRDLVYHRSSTRARAARAWRIIAFGAIVYDLAATLALAEQQAPADLRPGRRRLFTHPVLDTFFILVLRPHDRALTRVFLGHLAPLL